MMMIDEVLDVVSMVYIQKKANFEIVVAKVELVVVEVEN
jgi:hypothetical protein